MVTQITDTKEKRYNDVTVKDGVGSPETRERPLEELGTVRRRTVD